MQTEEQRARAKRIQAANPNANGPRFQYDPADATIHPALDALLEELRLDDQRDGLYRAPEAASRHPYFYARAMIEELKKEGVVLLWAINRRLANDDGSYGAGFDQLCDRIRAIPGVQFIQPDTAVELRRPDDWAPEFDRLVVDPDGWRQGSNLGAKDWAEPITRDEYEQRLVNSTTQPR